MRSIILNIGTSCFVRCPGCYNHFGNSIKKQTTISNSQVLAFVKELKEIGIQKLTIGGGDPLSRPDILELLKDIETLGMRINLDTVGTAFLEQTSTLFFGKLKIAKVPEKELIPAINIIGIPLDGSSNEIAALYRSGRADIFNEQIRIIRLLVNNNARVCVNTVLHKRNKTDFLNLYHILKEENIYKWQIFQFMPIGRFGYKNRDNYITTMPEFNRVKEEITAMNPPFQVEFKSNEDRKDNYLIIDDEGLAWSPAADDQIKTIGNIKTEPLAVIKFLLNESKDIRYHSRL